jgi:hypothetical protein
VLARTGEHQVYEAPSVAAFREVPARPIQQYDCRSFLRRGEMALMVTRSAGMLLLSVWLILTGLAGFVALPLPGVLMSALALIAGALILVGR